jgi:hypothetical protein
MVLKYSHKKFYSIEHLFALAAKASLEPLTLGWWGECSSTVPLKFFTDTNPKLPVVLFYQGPVFWNIMDL